MITLTDIKLHLRLDETDTTEDAFLQRLLDSAKQSVADHLDRNLYEEGETIPDEDTTGIYVKKPMEQAMLLMIGHFYEHRESASEVKIEEMPLGYWSLIRPYRRLGV